MLHLYYFLYFIYLCIKCMSKLIIIGIKIMSMAALLIINGFVLPPDFDCSF